MLQYYCLGSSAAETSCRSNEARGDRTVGKTAVFDRFNKFKAGYGDMMHERASRLPEINRRAILNTTETSPSLTTRMLAVVVLLDDITKPHRS
ncbi:hypothetical protein KIN20_008123 [Parelaphostrongylus tenuis]|uniref:Uncharacterized protein n=1 Tax=Parelaphostrongylus tenuis TaxID=148309 RepID=A0AAD5MWD4_PARTN|nr:hypothetical protein KIN20_008123 [Parelaphostrongylus tenuis]